MRYRHCFKLFKKLRKESEFQQHSSYLGNWRKRVNFSNSVAEIQQKYEREREKKWKKILIFGNHVTEIPVAQTWPQINCGNAIAEIGKKKIVAMPLPKMGGKKIK